MSSWSDNLLHLAERTERWLLWILVASVPIQRRLILFQSDWNFNEWRSGFLYGTDILVLGLVTIWLWRLIAHRDKLSRSSLAMLVCGTVMIFAAALSAKGALLPHVSWYLVVKLVEFVVLAAYVSSAVKRFGWNGILTALIIGGSFQALIATIQLIVQTDLGLSVLGESVIRPYLTGIASFYTFAGEKLIRSYGTTPHPNVLAMYLVLALFAWWALFLHRPHLKRISDKTLSWILIFAYALMLWGLFATFSRTVIALWGLMMVFLLVLSFANRTFRQRLWFGKMHDLMLIGIGITIVVIAIFSCVYWDAVFARLAISASDEAVTLRMYYNGQALRVGSGINWCGIGIGNFASWLMVHASNAPRYLYQPAHNVYLLAYAETGIVGVFAVVVILCTAAYALVRQFRRSKYSAWMLSTVFALILSVAVFDHFFWTLQQGQLMLWMFLGSIAASFDFLHKM